MFVLPNPRGRPTDYVWSSSSDNSAKASATQCSCAFVSTSSCPTELGKKLHGRHAILIRHRYSTSPACVSLTHKHLTVGGSGLDHEMHWKDGQSGSY